MSAIWVIVRDGRTEGYSAPIQAAKDEAEARRLISLIDATSHDRLALFRVPLWPEPQTVSWHSIKPADRA